VTSTIEGLTISGRADRIDRLASGGLIIRDYKSGRCRGDLAQAVRNAFAQIDSGEEIFGDAPRGLNLQTILYLPGVEEAFGQRVCRLDYLYFRGTDEKRNELFIDSTAIVDSAGNGVPARTLTRDDLTRVRRDLGGKIAEVCRLGTMTAFATTRDESLCTFCAFVRICPGHGTIAVS
jgi:hypothetical protein